VTQTLVVAEKFNTALRIAVVLSDGLMKRSRISGTNVFRFDRPDGHYAVVGLRGHIVELDYPKELAEWSLETLPKLLEAEPLKRVTAEGIVNALQEIVREFDRELEIFCDARREGSGFIRHFAGFTGDMERMAHENTRNAMFRANGAKAREVFAAIFAGEDEQGLRGEAEFVREGEADAFAAVVEGQNARERVCGAACVGHVGR